MPKFAANLSMMFTEVPFLDRFEQAGDEFHRAVRDGFLAQALAEPERWVVIDGTGTVDEVARAVWAAVEPVMESE